jgi:hypothetical protein
MLRQGDVEISVDESGICIWETHNRIQQSMLKSPSITPISVKEAVGQRFYELNVQQADLRLLNHKIYGLHTYR